MSGVARPKAGASGKRPATKASAAGKRAKVRISERCVFYVGERAYLAGQVVELAKAEADALIASGQGEQLGRRSRRTKEPSPEPDQAEPFT